jgi:hypothetical protein
MKVRWHNAILTFVLAGASALTPLAAAVQHPRTPIAREHNRTMRRDIRQDTRQLRNQRRDIRADRRQLQAARQKYGQGSPRARAIHRDVRQDRRTASVARRDRNHDIRIHRQQVVAHPPKK